MRFFCWFLIFIPVFAFGQRQEFFHPQMGTLFQIILYTKDTLQGQAIARQLFARIDSLNATFSDYLESSEITRLSNSAGTGQKIKVSRDMWRLLRIAQQISLASDGAFDLSIGPLTKLWRRAFRQSQFPNLKEVEAARQKVNFRAIQFYPLSRKVELQTAGMRLDAGGIAKGFAVDECFKLLLQAGVRSALVAAGGDIRVGVAPPDKPHWVIASKGMNATGEVQDQELYYQNCAVSTSGDTYRFLDWEGRRYSHIIDPRTGLGMQHRQFTRVSGPSSAWVDGLDTAANVMSPADREKLMKKFPRYKLEQYESKD